MKHIFYLNVFLILIPMVSTGADNYSFEPSRGQVPIESQRDPFTTSDKMFAQTNLRPGERADVYGGFIPGYGASPQGAPKMRLKGYVTKNVSKATALLEIEGAGVFMVSKGDEIGLHAIGSNGVLKVIEVGPNGVRVQSGRLNQVILVK